MEIRRITNQRLTLDEFYGELASLGPENVYSKVGVRMLEFLRLLREREGVPVWAVTSLDTLNLVTGDDYRLPTLVSITCHCDHFRIQRLIRPDAPQGRRVYVTERATNISLAVDLVLLGLTEALSPVDSGSEPA